MYDVRVLFKDSEKIKSIHDILDLYVEMFGFKEKGIVVHDNIAPWHGNDEYYYFTVEVDELEDYDKLNEWVKSVGGTTMVRMN